LDWEGKRGILEKEDWELLLEDGRILERNEIRGGDRRRGKEIGEKEEKIGEYSIIYNNSNNNIIYVCVIYNSI
jgi:mRNA-degrading endonuclease RelE of RelBE toxin-antitoxin system